MSTGLSELNRALNRIPKRAEQRHADQLRATFEDSGVSALLEAPDHQVVYGRRGTGKTHALRFLEGQVRDNGDLGVYLDLRTIGSPEGLFAGRSTPATERAAKLLVDLLGQLHEALLEAALNDDALIEDVFFVAKLDALSSAITTVRVKGEIEVERQYEKEVGEANTRGIGGGVSPAGPRLGARLEGTSSTGTRALQREIHRGSEGVHLNFSEVGRALKDLIESLPGPRLWLLLDEWSSVPPEVQPYIGEFLVRSVLPLQRVTVKVAAIEQQSAFRSQLEDGNIIGIELGADVSANVDLDEFMVFEQNEERSRSFFRGLFFKHLTSGIDVNEDKPDLATQTAFIQRAFTDRRAFDELVRASEGVPRDAINIAAKAAFGAGSASISVPHVRAAARSWYQTDKEAAIRSHDDALALLNWIIDLVIRGKKARGFLVNQRSAGAPLLLALFDARVLHIVRRGYSAQDTPGERYDVWVIDYGAYVDLVHTKYEPQGLLAVGGSEDAWVDVPAQDLRAIRRAILDLDAFYSVKGF